MLLSREDAGSPALTPSSLQMQSEPGGLQLEPPTLHRSVSVPWDQLSLSQPEAFLPGEGLSHLPGCGVLVVFAPL